MIKIRVYIIFLMTIMQVYSAPSSSWYFDELGNSTYAYTTKDNAGPNDGVAYDMASSGNVAGKICSAFDLSVSSIHDYVVLDENVLHGLGNFTISAWLKGTSTAGRALISGARTGQDNALLGWFSSDTRFIGYVDNAGGGSSIVIPSISDNIWHHFVWRRIGTQSCVFIDGILRGCRTISNSLLNIEYLVLGQEQDGVGGRFSNSQDWEGLVDELLIFNTGLTNAEILSVYTNQNAGNSWNGGARTCEVGVAPDLPVDNSYSDYHFDEIVWTGAANEVKDSHDTNHGQGINVSSVAGKICNAMDFRLNSTTDYTILGKDALDGAKDFTISVWHKGNAGDDSNSLLSGAHSTSNNELIFWMSSETTFAAHLNGINYGNTGTSNINTSTWKHLVWRRKNNQSCFFIDAALQGCKTTHTPLVLIDSLVMGQEQDSVGGGFQGSQDWEGILDELIIFRRALSNSEITTGYNNQNNKKNWNGTSRICPKLSVTKTSMVISDPINLTSNPKRIPGAVMRYCFKVENASTVTTNNIVLKDNLSGNNKDNLSYVKSGFVKQNVNTACNCLAISNTSGTIAGTLVSINIGTLTPSSTLPATAKACAYIEVTID